MILYALFLHTPDTLFMLILLLFINILIAGLICLLGYFLQCGTASFRQVNLTHHIIGGVVLWCLGRFGDSRTVGRHGRERLGETKFGK